MELDYAYRERIRNYQLRGYLYGAHFPLPPSVSEASLGGESLTEMALSPHSSIVSFDDMKIYRIGEGELYASDSERASII